MVNKLISYQAINRYKCKD